MRKNPFFKIAVISLSAVIILWFIGALINGSGNGINLRFNNNVFGHHYEGGFYMGNGFAYGGTLTTLLMIIIKILFAVFVLGLVGGLVVWAKNYLFTEEDRAAIRNTFATNKVQKQKCSICERELENDWKACPHCGKEKETVQTA